MAELVKVARVEEIPPGAAKRILVGGEPVALFNVAGEFLAVADTCSHESASLSEGYLDEDVVECPVHGARFSLRTGRHLSLPAVAPVASFEVRVEDGDILVARKG